jgi:hypothetical protein
VRRIEFSAAHTEPIELAAGDVVQISVGTDSPSRLPDNGRIAVEWSGPDDRAGWRKILHALDPDVYVVFRAPQAGTYQLDLRTVQDEEPHFNRPRWRETGIVAQVHAFPQKTAWPASHQVPLSLCIQHVDYGTSQRGMTIEAEPNDSIEQAQALPVLQADDEQSLHIMGGSDDVEYFDNGLYGESGEDWFRLEYRGTEPRLLSVNMMPTDPLVAARVRCYRADGQEFTQGKHLNEMAHEQVEEHRTAIVRMLEPGGVYYLRIEANSPGYDVDIRLRRPAPLTDPRQSLRLALYDHVAQVSAWLMNRPRGNSLDRRLRDTGSLYGSNCMSCHTQSGVWGPAVPIEFGYRVENPLHYQLLQNIMYESLRPTNVLVDAANNTSLAPHDLGDGPAGTRVAGHAVLSAETVLAPRKLHSRQQIRTANYILQTADPSGINAAGNGSNVGQAVVVHYAAEILRRAWDKTHDSRYLSGIVTRAERMLEIQPRLTDDLAHRVIFFRRVLPLDQVAGEVASSLSSELQERIARQTADDLEWIRRSQREDGAWGFAPGKVDDQANPAPTALAIDALVAAGATLDDTAVQRGVQALLAMQHPYGLWNRSARTGFVTTAYVMNTLGRLYPDSAAPRDVNELLRQPDESLADRVARLRQLALDAFFSAGATADLRHETLGPLRESALDASPQARYWALIGLGALHCDEGVATLLDGLDDPVKMVREAARWGLRQTLLDDHGWPQVLAACINGSDLQREQLAAALVMRADAATTGSQLDLNRLAETLDQMMSDDPHPAVRAWASRAAWNWWVWNPPLRARLNQAYVRMLSAAEPSALAQNAKRYQLQALLIANGNRASANYDNPYRELADLYEAILARCTDESLADRISERLTAVAATYYNSAYGANGNGQLGYATPNASAAIGKAIHRYWKQAEQANDRAAVQLAIEASANVIDEDVQQKLLNYSVEGPEQLRSIAATSLSDPRAVRLPTSPEFMGPLMERFYDSAQTEEGRRQIVRSTIRQLIQARWDFPESEGRQREFYRWIIPKLDDPESDVQWFVAEQLGRVLAANPDFHTETLLTLVPQSFAHPLEESYWLPSVRWMLTYDTPVPEVGQSPVPESRPELRRFAVELLVRNLRDDVDRRLRERAIALLYEPALYSHPDVIAAVEPDGLGRFRDFLPDEFQRDVQRAVAADPVEPKLTLTPERRRNLEYFRQFVIPELGRVNRSDGESCFSCHGGGKIPSMSLAAAERRTNYISPADVWSSYRTLLQRIDVNDIEHSKVLRKPLNIQSGEEDGHQGGMRYRPGDRGHEILRRWVYDAAKLAAD